MGHQLINWMLKSLLNFPGMPKNHMDLNYVMIPIDFHTKVCSTCYEMRSTIIILLQLTMMLNLARIMER